MKNEKSSRNHTVSRPNNRRKPTSQVSKRKPTAVPIFLKSAVWPADYPPAGAPEIAIVGRSNAGKSSLLNAIWGLEGPKKLAKVSSTPGKTRLLNFFEKPQKYRIVDVPGYGFAVRSETERLSWRECIEQYFQQRECLVGVILVMDIRRDWQMEESDLVQWLHPVPWLLVLTKSDKLNKSQILQRKRMIQEEIRRVRVSPPVEVSVCSALSGAGADEVEMLIYKKWVAPAKTSGNSKVVQ